MALDQFPPDVQRRHPAAEWRLQYPLALMFRVDIARLDMRTRLPYPD
jgi:hypothetical protein